ncbi:MAG: hypothetical protein M1819_000909 [Sarea resinae]|nr:MAG: hypothetical protein M1819_000909 [Sarea resinae]
MRSKHASSLQKTYDECYLVCSTAVYFEGQNNEAEALRSWRDALDQIYYHNAYRVPPNYKPKSETERALMDSLRELEMQCKERVDLLEALRQSRLGAKSSEENLPNGHSPRGKHSLFTSPRESSGPEKSAAIGQGTVPTVSYSDLSRPTPILPQRPPPMIPRSSTHEAPRSRSVPKTSKTSRPSTSPQNLPIPNVTSSRSPSPDKKKGMLMTLRKSKDGKKSPKAAGTMRSRPPAAAKAATQAWSSKSRADRDRLGQSLADAGASTTTVDSFYRDSHAESPMPKEDSGVGQMPDLGARATPLLTPSGPDYMRVQDSSRPADTLRRNSHNAPYPVWPKIPSPSASSMQLTEDQVSPNPPTPPPHRSLEKLPIRKNPNATSLEPSMRLGMDSLPYKGGSPSVNASAKKTPPLPMKPPRLSIDASRSASSSSYPSPRTITNHKVRSSAPPNSSSKRALAKPPTARRGLPSQSEPRDSDIWGSGEESSSDYHPSSTSGPRSRKHKEEPLLAGSPPTPTSTSSESSDLSPAEREWKARVERLMNNLPKGVDPAAASQIFNEIVVKGDEVHWDDVAGLDAAKNALKEAVVYPFLRPDLFMGLREPARGMLLFGPPGTGKTMLARAVATESRSTFFSISASSLTSKYLGESEKLVRALFAIAKALAPSIIFVDEIDSLLSSRSGSGEHEATRRIKTEFLIQWSDLARAAAGREQSEREKEKGDASRVLVLAATNLPWAIDEAARRRFVRRQYIPLPEGPVRAMQLRTLMGHQKHELSDEDIEVLVQLTDGYSGSDITALAKDAAMGPLRSLGEALLHMSMDQIRPIQCGDFEASLVNIRPSVSSEGLKQYEEWARQFGERGG